MEDIATADRPKPRPAGTEALLRLLAEHVQAVLWTTDRDLRITAFVGGGLSNGSAPRPDPVGVTLYEYYGTRDPDFVPIAAHLRAARGESVTYDFDLGDGHYQAFVDPLCDGARRTVGCVGVALNVTDYRREQQEREDLEEELEAALKGFNDPAPAGHSTCRPADVFLYWLTVIRGYTQLLIPQFRSGDHRLEWLRGIQKAGDRATSLVRRFLGAGRDPVAPVGTRADLAASLARIERLLRTLIGSEVQLICERVPAGIRVEADALQVEQIILNLVVMARCLAPAGARMGLEAAASGRYGVVSVCVSASDGASLGQALAADAPHGGRDGELGPDTSVVHAMVACCGGRLEIVRDGNRRVKFRALLPRRAGHRGAGAARPVAEGARHGGDDDTEGD
jgi:hypothetical protein